MKNLESKYSVNFSSYGAMLQQESVKMENSRCLMPGKEDAFTSYSRSMVYIENPVVVVVR